METVLTTSPTEAAEFIKRGGLVAFPTETVYGLGANVFDEQAVKRIFAAKQRPADNPLIAHVGGKEQIDSIAAVMPPAARVFIDAFFPGPLTVVLPKAAGVPEIATAGLETIGVRMPGHPAAVEFLKACGTPVVAPSANLSGRPSPTTWEAVYEDLNGRIDCILQGEATEIGLESTVVDCTENPPEILRTGAISLEQLRSLVPETMMYEPLMDERPRSPGLKHRHYSPHGDVLLITPGTTPKYASRSAFIGLTTPEANFRLIRICDSSEEYARSVFEFFRECDRRKIKTIYCEVVAEQGIGAALMDRLRRAAAK
jgi:L-threonylcarbamoyladenylate synthase